MDWGGGHTGDTDADPPLPPLGPVSTPRGFPAGEGFRSCPPTGASKGLMALAWEGDR